MNKKLIRLTESDLHRIVKESVNEVFSNKNYKNNFGDIEKTKYNANSDNLDEVMEKLNHLINHGFGPTIANIIGFILTNGESGSKGINLKNILREKCANLIRKNPNFLNHLLKDNEYF